MRKYGIGWRLFVPVALAVLAPFYTCGSAVASGEQALVDSAHVTLAQFQDSKDMGLYRDLLRQADGVLIVPELYKAGFLLGGSGGEGVLFVRDEKTGGWSGPAFYNLGSFTGGLQVGAEVSEAVILVMSREGIEALYSPSIRLGTDVSVAVGPVGSGAAGSTAPNPKAAFLTFMRSKGAYIGLTLEGTVVDTADDSNEAYYSRPVRPVDILRDDKVSNPDAAGLKNDLSGFAAKKPK